MNRKLSRIVVALGSATMSLLNMGCATRVGPHPARLSSTSPQVMARVKAVLATAMGTNRIELGPEDHSRSTSLTVLPPPLGPLETRSLAVPSVFDIVKEGASCALVARTTGRRFPLTGVACTIVVPKK
jgi:hypothetical protein